MERLVRLLYSLKELPGRGMKRNRPRESWPGLCVLMALSLGPILRSVYICRVPIVPCDHCYILLVISDYLLLLFKGHAVNVILCENTLCK